MKKLLIILIIMAIFIFAAGVIRINLINKYTDEGVVYLKNNDINNSIHSLSIASNLGGETSSYMLYIVYSREEYGWMDKEKSLKFLKKISNFKDVINIDYRDGRIDREYYDYFMSSTSNDS